MSEFSSVGELEVFAKAIKEHLTKEIGDLKIEMKEEFIKMEKKQDALEENQKYTNGKVKKLELWKAYFIGIITALNVFVYPIASFLLYNYLTNHIK